MENRHFFNKWINDYARVSKWMAQYDIIELLQNNELVKIRNFLPRRVAEGALSMLEDIPESQWNDTHADHDLSNNNISHKFSSCKNSLDVPELCRAVSLLLPGCLSSLSVARYTGSDYIAPHDDKAYTDVLMDDGTIVQCSRNITVVYYLTKNWDKSCGGEFVDVEGGDSVVPEFNLAVLFTIPRLHAVTPVTPGKVRYSLFGWFLERGKLYPLNTGEEGCLTKKDGENNAERWWEECDDDRLEILRESEIKKKNIKRKILHIKKMLLYNRLYMLSKSSRSNRNFILNSSRKRLIYSFKNKSKI
eukprot:GHVR01035690.1.p1 GENE.GHVR01035690.1~~GHVR01035690.1.p1  ORF type:complete len:304 (+),score=65.47 GHVR01035690.1:80-991(+)